MIIVYKKYKIAYKTYTIFHAHTAFEPCDKYIYTYTTLVCKNMGDMMVIVGLPSSIINHGWGGIESS